MAILSGVRGQSLYLLNIFNMTIEPDYVSLRISETTKTSKPGSGIQEIRFDAYPIFKRLCVVYYIKVYLERTLKLRWLKKSFFLCYGKYDSTPERDTVRRWIRDTLIDAGVDMTIFGPHSTRSASTSAARASGVHLRTILKTAGWTTPSCFQRFYNKPLMQTCTMQKALLKRYHNSRKWMLCDK